MRSGAEHIGAHWYKIPDVPKVAGLRFMIKKPYDAYALHGKVFAAVEAKDADDDGRFYLKDVTRHQLESLREVRENGGNAWIAVRLHGPVRAFILSVDLFDEAKDRGMKSLDAALVAGLIARERGNGIRFLTRLDVPPGTVWNVLPLFFRRPRPGADVRVHDF